MFEGPRLKIKRANQHIAELNDSLNAFVKTDFYKFHVEKDVHSGNYVLKFEMVKDVPCEIPLIIGDAAHNLRATLDLAICELVTLCGGTPDKWTYFPFRDTRDELKNMMNGGVIKVAGTDIIDLILDVIKPYKGGNNVLYALHDLDIGDKHRLLIPTFSVAALHHVNAKAGGISFIDCTLGVDQGGKLNLVSMPGPFEFQGKGEPSISVSFGKGQSFEGQAVIPTLHQLSQLVSGTIDAIEKAYIARK